MDGLGIYEVQLEYVPFLMHIRPVDLFNNKLLDYRGRRQDR